MGTYFTVYPDRLRSNGEKLDSIAKAIENAQQRSLGVSRGLNGSLDRVRYSLCQTMEKMDIEAHRVMKASNALNEISGAYSFTDIIVGGITFDFRVFKDNSPGSSSKEEDALKEIWPVLKKMIGKMPIAKAIMDYTDFIKAIADPNMKDLILGNLKFVEGSAYVASIIAKYGNGGLVEALKKAVSWSSYFPEGTQAGLKFTEYLNKAFGVEIGKYHDFSDASKTAGTIAKWAGAVIEVATEGFENYEEFKGSGNWMRMFGETVIESGTDIGLGIAGAALIGAIGGVGAPAILVAAGGVAVVALANEGCKWLTEMITGEGKDIGEVVSDFVLDTTEKVIDYGKKAVDYVADTAKNVYDTVSDGVAKIGESVSNWFGFAW